MASTTKVLAFFCVVLLLITAVTAGPVVQREQRRLTGVTDIQLQDHFSKSYNNFEEQHLLS